MPDWDSNSPRSAANLAQLLYDAVSSSKQRKMLTVKLARDWHRGMMSGLAVPEARFVGAFRGEARLETLQVQVLSIYGTPASEVSGELIYFEAKLQRLIKALDLQIAVGEQPDVDQVAAILETCAWAHADWIRIHPFANGNGRTARLWANSIAIRYGLPPFLPLRPRPGGHYGYAGEQAMHGNWKPTVAVFRNLLDHALDTI